MDDLRIRSRYRLLIAGMIAGLAPLLILSFLPELITGTPILSYVWTFPFLILIPIIYAYTVCQEELGHIDQLLNQSLIYTLLTLLLMGVYRLFILVQQVARDWPWVPMIVGTTLALIVTIYFVPIRNRLQKLVDHLFYGGWYDYRTVVQAASTEFNRARDMDRMVEQLMNVAHTMRFQQAALLWNEMGAMKFKSAFGYGPETLELLRVSSLRETMGYLQGVAQPQVAEEVAQGVAPMILSAGERALVHDGHVLLWLPLVSRRILYGVLIMGRRQGDVPLDREDLDILVTLAGHAAVAAENVVLLESLRTRLSEMESIKNQLSEAQQRLVDASEQERLYLAQELHDGPVQDLYGIRFVLGELSEELHDCSARNRPSMEPEQAPADYPAREQSIETQEMIQQVIEAQDMIRQVTDTLRMICHELRPPILTAYGLEAAIRSHAKIFSKKYPLLEIQFDLMQDGQTLPERVRLALFRIYQETLNNIGQHAEASCVLVRLQLDAHEVVLEVRDDGRGFVVPVNWIESAREGHLGLLGAYERATSIDGQLEVISAIDEGTLVRVIAPHAPASELLVGSAQEHSLNQHRGSTEGATQPVVA